MERGVIIPTKKFLKSRILSKQLKLTIKEVLFDQVTHGCKAWTLANSDEQQLRIFEHKILQRWSLELGKLKMSPGGYKWGTN